VLIGLCWLSLTERKAPRYGIQPNRLYNLVLIALVSGILGARLAYVLRYPAAFAASPFSLFSLNPDLLDPWGGLAVGLLSGVIYAQRKNLPFWPLLDALTPAFGTMAVAFGLANLASGDAYGASSNLPWSIDLWGERRHPVQIYNPGALIIPCGPAGPRYFEKVAFRNHIRDFPGPDHRFALVLRSIPRRQSTSPRRTA
jgi:prolipoprotein diacylglyceryltransferase